MQDHNTRRLIHQGKYVTREDVDKWLAEPIDPEPKRKTWHEGKGFIVFFFSMNVVNLAYSLFITGRMDNVILSLIALAFLLVAWWNSK